MKVEAAICEVVHDVPYSPHIFVRARLWAILMAMSTVALPKALSAEHPTIVIRVVAYTDSPSEVLIEAQHHVARVFGVAGITVVWRDGQAEAPANIPLQVTVVLLSDAMTQEKTTNEKIARSVLGTAAPPPGHRAWIFCRRVEEAAEKQGRSTGLVLGHVIVHEVAHMVANLGHSEAGVMMAAVQKSSTLQGFTKEEGQQLRAAIQSESGAIMLNARDRPRPFRPGDR